MKFLFRQKTSNWDKPFSERIAKRVSKIPTGELETWSDQTIYEVGRLLSTYQKHRSKEVLDELLVASEAMHAVINELHNRISK